MIRYILLRILTMIPTLFLISVLVFFIIELPPGDYFESYVSELRALGEDADLAEIEMLRETLRLRSAADRALSVVGRRHADMAISAIRLNTACRSTRWWVTGCG